MKKNLYLLFCIVFATGSVLHSFAQSSTRIITTYAGNGFVGYSGDNGAATAATLASPTSLAMDGTGNLYVCDQQNHCIRKVNISGVITTVAGTGKGGFSGEGMPATDAKFNLNWGVAVDGAGNIYISDQVNHRVRKVNSSGIVSTIAGTGTPGFLGDSGPATDAKINSPLGVAVDGAGNIYIADQSNFRVRKIDASGIISTVAGDGTFSSGGFGDGNPAITARLNYISGLSVDAAGNLYIAEWGDNRVRKVNTSGVISTFAGTGTAAHTGDGGLAVNATLNKPYGVFAANTGDIYIADAYNNCIRKVNPSGIISSVTGNGGQGYGGDGGPATNAEMNHPVGVTVDNDGNIYVADVDNIRVRKVSNFNSLSFVNNSYQALSACQNATSGLDTLLAITDFQYPVTDVWSLLRAPLHGIANASYSKSSIGAFMTPSGLSYTPSTGYTGNDTFSVVVNDGIMSDTTTIYVTVHPQPSAGLINGPSRVCVGSSITLSDNAAGGIWTSSNATAIVNGGKVTGLAGGVDTIIYTVTNVCGTAITSKTVDVKPLPNPGTIYGPASMCTGVVVKLAKDKDGGVWSSGNAHATIDSGIVTAVSPGNAIIYYTVTDSFCSAAASLTIPIDPYPTVERIKGSQFVCRSSVTVLADSTPGGTWTSSNPPCIMHRPDVPANQCYYLGITPGTDTLSYSVANACGVTTERILITTLQLPDTPEIVQNERIFAVSGNYTSYQWSFNEKFVAGATKDSIVADTTGNYFVTVTNSFGCAVSSVPVVYSGCTLEDLKIYPNPATSIVNLHWCHKVNARLVTASGKELKLIKNINQIDISNLPASSYFLYIYDANGHEIKMARITKTK